ncbi:unnamed protein product [Discosporangium mesarthrocarpum]
MEGKENETLCRDPALQCEGIGGAARSIQTDMGANIKEQFGKPGWGSLACWSDAESTGSTASDGNVETQGDGRRVTRVMENAGGGLIGENGRNREEKHSSGTPKLVWSAARAKQVCGDENDRGGPALGKRKIVGDGRILYREEGVGPGEICGSGSAAGDSSSGGSTSSEGSSDSKWLDVLVEDGREARGRVSELFSYFAEDKGPYALIGGRARTKEFVKCWDNYGGGNPTYEIDTHMELGTVTRLKKLEEGFRVAKQSRNEMSQARAGYLSRAQPVETRSRTTNRASPTRSTASKRAREASPTGNTSGNDGESGSGSGVRLAKRPRKACPRAKFLGNLKGTVTAAEARDDLAEILGAVGRQEKLERKMMAPLPPPLPPLLLSPSHAARRVTDEIKCASRKSGRSTRGKGRTMLDYEDL